MKYVDLSHTIENGIVTYKGLPAPLICDFLSRKESLSHYDGDTTFQIGKVEMVGNTGTYIDCPFHRFEDGKNFSELFVSDLADLQAVKIVCHTHANLAIGIDQFIGLDISDKAVLVETGWSVHWNTDTYFENHPYLTEEAAIYLRDEGAKLVGIDSYNIDDTRKRSRPVHSVLLGAGIPIVEHLCQEHLVPEDNFYFSAVPPKIVGMGSFPVRAYARF